MKPHFTDCLLTFRFHIVCLRARSTRTCRTAGRQAVNRPGRGNKGGKDQLRAARGVAADHQHPKPKTPTSRFIAKSHTVRQVVCRTIWNLPRLPSRFKCNGEPGTGIIPSWRAEARSRLFLWLREAAKCCSRNWHKRLIYGRKRRYCPSVGIENSIETFTGSAPACT